ncbi:DUF4232 domain-containing protein [Streptomyces sp. NPDC050856]|uniref:DUF4232 domain-containing protein n=1 Tax=Streptomyces sp. NPDC050856 TaxID=3154939 RepID=UPI0034014741
MRTFRTRTTTIAATALLAALSLTACQNGDGPGAAGGAASPSAGAPKPPSSTAPASPAAGGTTGGATAKPAGTGSGSAAGTGGGTPGNGSGSGSLSGSGSGAGKGTGGPAGTAGAGSSDSAPVTEPCGADVKVTYTAVHRPLNHGLLTLTNTGSKACDAYYAPLLRFDDAQSATTVNDSSKPQAVVTLGPGESAYASITLAAADGSGGDGRTARKLAVGFAPRDGRGSTDAAPVVITLPAGTYTDTSANVTYWQSSMDDALMH